MDITKTKTKLKKVLSPRTEIKKLRVELKHAKLTLTLKNQQILEKESKIQDLRNQHGSYDQKIREIVNGHTAAIAAVEKAHSERSSELIGTNSTMGMEVTALRARVAKLVTLIQEMSRTL